ncbi:unnamed protein product [Phytophthora fragariaefolia]|uniref:Unnamed protein product n=1 Tax=Phytophthora fragariaefolia TaxID=1490495 RepID=A0A9W7CQ76_9STRA|nr:unnamed protein product [Phytophthora fragariaefolia]
MLVSPRIESSIPAWRDLTDTIVYEELNLDLPLDELEIGSDEEGYGRYVPEAFLPARLAEVEAVKSMHFDPHMKIEAPNDLYCSGAAVACVRGRRRLTESEYESVRSLSTDS